MSDHSLLKADHILILEELGLLAASGDPPILAAGWAWTVLGLDADWLTEAAGTDHLESDWLAQVVGTGHLEADWLA